MARGGLRMRKEINLPYASAIMIGIIIGSGIFVSPVSFTRHCGSVGASLIMWVLSGVLALFIALCFNELGSIYPASGGEYTFFKHILGPLPAFLDAWMHFMIVQPSFYALLALTTTDYMFHAIYPDCEMPPAVSLLTTSWVIVTVVLINSLKMRYVKRVQAFFTLTKLVALGLIIVGGVIQLGKGRTEYLQNGFEGTNHNPGGYAIAIHSGIFTYMGWQYIFCLMEEVKNARKIVPRATVISFAVVISLYTLTNVAYYSVMSPRDMIASKAVAMDFAKRALGPLAPAMPVFVASSTIGALNGAIMGGSRIYFVAARDNLFPALMSTIQIKYLTPWISLFTVCLLSILYAVTGNAVALVEYLGFNASLMLLTACSCLLYLRWKRPDIERPFKVPLVIPVVSVTVLTFVVVLGLYHQPVVNGIGILLVLSGVPVYLVGVHGIKRIRTLRIWNYKVTCFMQKVFLVLPVERD